MTKTKINTSEQLDKAEQMFYPIYEDRFIPGVPLRPLTEEEYCHYLKTFGKIVERFYAPKTEVSDGSV